MATRTRSKNLPPKLIIPKGNGKHVSPELPPPGERRSEVSVHSDPSTSVRPPHNSGIPSRDLEQEIASQHQINLNQQAQIETLQVLVANLIRSQQPGQQSMTRHTSVHRSPDKPEDYHSQADSGDNDASSPHPICPQRKDGRWVGYTLGAQLGTDSRLDRMQEQLDLLLKGRSGDMSNLDRTGGSPLFEAILKAESKK